MESYAASDHALAVGNSFSLSVPETRCSLVNDFLLHTIVKSYLFSACKLTSKFDT